MRYACGRYAYNSPMAIRHGVCIIMLNTARHPAADAADDAAAIAF